MIFRKGIPQKMDPRLFPRTPRSDLNPEVADKNVIDGPRAKTIDAGESPEWGKATGTFVEIIWYRF